MPHSIFLRSFIDELARTTDREAPEIEEELRGVAEAAAIDVLGAETPLEVRLSRTIGSVTVAQALTVVAVVENPARELSLLDARRVDPESAVGDQLLIPVHYTHDARERAVRERLEGLSDRLPLPLRAEGLWDALTTALNEALLRYFPAPEFPEGTLWGMLASGGGWTRGISVEADGVTLTVESAYLTYTRLDPNLGWVDLGYRVRVQGGVVYGGGDLWHLRRGDNDGIVRTYGALPSDASARANFEEELAALARQIAAAKSGTGAMSEVTACDRLNVAALTPAAPGSLMLWCQEHLPGLLEGRTWTHGYDHDGRRGRLSFRVETVYPPTPGLSYFGYSSIALRIHDVESGANTRDVLQLGSLRQPALAPGTGPQGADALADCEALVEVFTRWLDVHLAHHVASRGPELGMNYLYAFDGHFPLVELIEHRLRDGPPGPPPVPEFDDAALDRAAALLRPVTAAQRQRAEGLLGSRVPLALLAVGGFVVALCDDATRRPHGDAWIGILPPSGERVSEVMRVDVWNPSSKAVVDGDAFAFRRFTAWLRGALPRAGLDRAVTFREREDEDDVPEDEEPEEREWTMPLSEWLRFGLPELPDDRFLVDWRHQWHVVFAGSTIPECFGGIYGMSGEERRTMATRDRRVWRTFLREMIDSRFPA